MPCLPTSPVTSPAPRSSNVTGSRPPSGPLAAVLALAALAVFHEAAAAPPTSAPLEASRPGSPGVSPAGQATTRIRIHELAAQGTTGQVEIRFDRAAPARATLTGNEKNPVIFEGDCSPDTTSVEVVARLTIRMAGGGTETPEVRRSFQVVGPSGLVFGGSGAFDPAAAYRAFLKAEGVDARLLEEPRPEAEKAIAAAEQRLGFRLHPDHRALLTRLGPIRAGDFYMIEAARLEVARRQLVTLWGDEARRAESLRPEVRDLLGRSTMILVDAGDGYSAFLWERGDPGAGWQLDQGSWTPRRMEDEEGRPLSFRAALGRVLSRLAENYLPSNGREGRIRIHPGKLNVLYLDINRFGGGLGLDLVSE